MTYSPWTPAADYAIAIASGMGLSNQQIAKLLGPEFTRNSVIGRRHRIGLCDAGTTLKFPKPAIAKPRAPHVNIRRWTEAQDQIIRDHYMEGQSVLRGLLPHRSNATIYTRRQHLGLTTANFRFMPEHDAAIRENYLAQMPVEEMARSLGCNTGSLRQHIKHLGLSRDGRKTRLAKRFGLDVLTISDDPAEIRRVLIEREQAEEARKQEAEERRIADVLSAMKRAIEDGGDRKLEMQTALIAGATLRHIGDLYGISRERVRQIVHEIKPAPKPRPEPRRIICQECGEAFPWSKQGTPRYCEPCRTGPVAERKHQKSLIESRQFRASEEGRRYRRNWTRRSRLKEKMLKLDGPELAQVLREVAQAVGGGVDDIRT